MSNLLPDPLKHSTKYAPHLGSFTQASLLPGAGSERRYWRLSRADNSTVLLMYYGAEREENAAFAPLTHWLLSNHLRVPQILAQAQQQTKDTIKEVNQSGWKSGWKSGWIWLEDFGLEDLLFKASKEQSLCLTSQNSSCNSPTLLACYHATIEQLAKWHDLELSTLPQEAAQHLQKGFDESLYHWEQDYFWEHAMARLSSLSHQQQTQARQQSQAWMDDLAKQLASKPRVVIHRDFQSTNVMIPPQTGKQTTQNQPEIGIIDYQGLRQGLREYDLASLLYDPYVSLAPSFIHSCLEHYAKQSGINLDALQENITLAGIQRLMQALGAYSKLGLLEHKTRFLSYIKPARERLSGLLEQAHAPRSLINSLQSIQDASRLPNL